MNKRRELLAAGIVRDIRFQNEAEYDIHIYNLNHKYADYKLLEKVKREDGTVLARIVEQYNNTPLIQLYED